MRGYQFDEATIPNTPGARLCPGCPNPVQLTLYRSGESQLNQEARQTAQTVTSGSKPTSSGGAEFCPPELVVACLSIEERYGNHL